MDYSNDVTVLRRLGGGGPLCVGRHGGVEDKRDVLLAVALCGSEHHHIVFNRSAVEVVQGDVLRDGQRERVGGDGGLCRQSAREKEERGGGGK